MSDSRSGGNRGRTLRNTRPALIPVWEGPIALVRQLLTRVQTENQVFSVKDSLKSGVQAAGVIDIW